jgi:hypothetical protein
MSKSIDSRFSMKSFTDYDECLGNQFSRLRSCENSTCGVLKTSAARWGLVGSHLATSDRPFDVCPWGYGLLDGEPHVLEGLAQTHRVDHGHRRPDECVGEPCISGRVRRNRTEQAMR